MIVPDGIDSVSSAEAFEALKHAPTSHLSQICNQCLL